MSKLTELCDEILARYPERDIGRLVPFKSIQAVARPAKVMEEALKEIRSEPTYSGYDVAEDALSQV